MPTSIAASGCMGLYHVVQSYFLSVIIRDCAINQNTRIMLVNGHCYKLHTALSSFRPHSEW